MPLSVCVCVSPVSYLGSCRASETVPHNILVCRVKRPGFLGVSQWVGKELARQSGSRAVVSGWCLGGAGYAHLQRRKPVASWTAPEAVWAAAAGEGKGFCQHRSDMELQLSPWEERLRQFLMCLDRDPFIKQ